ncbi:MAG: hypothetical protein ACK4NF_06460, partial [Planctomycetota bacterium]
FLMLDVTDYNTQFDKYLSKIISRTKKIMILCFNKIDLLTQQQLSAEKIKIENEFSFLKFVPRVFLSAKTSKNIHEPFSVAIDLYKRAKTHIQTSYLNKIIERICGYKIFKRRTKVGKIYYATQVGTSPLEIALFVNDKTFFSPSDLKFIENKLRQEAGLLNIPIALRLVERR